MILLTSVGFASEVEFFCPPLVESDGELCEGDTISFKSESMILVKIQNVDF